jgi:hypothetical protein
MIIKNRDAQSARIVNLEQRIAASKDADEIAATSQAVARLRSDSTTAAACKFIDGLFADTSNWVVLHDLRIQFGSKSIHINHLLINSMMEFFCIDSRYINGGLSISAQGVCHSLNRDHSTLISSPLSKMHRDTRFLTQLLKQSDILPRQFGIRKLSKVRGFILTHSAYRIGRPAADIMDTSSVVSRDSLFSLIWEEPKHWLTKTVKPVTEKELAHVGNSISSLHKPAIAAHLMELKFVATQTETAIEQDSAHCSECGVPVTAPVREQAFRNMEVFGSRVLCSGCQVFVWQKSKRANCW